MTLLRIALAILGVVFGLMILWASGRGDFWASGAWMTSDPWGLVTLTDLYLGLVLAAVVIGLTERGWAALFWILPLPILGNLWTVLWFVVRMPVLLRRLRSDA